MALWSDTPDLNSIPGFNSREAQAVAGKQKHQQSDECIGEGCPICKEYDREIYLSNPCLP